MRAALMLVIAVAAATVLAVPRDRVETPIPGDDGAYAGASAGEPTFESVGTAQGLTSSTIFAVLVDRHGFVWFSGDSGVHRYDGLHVQTFDRQPNRRNTLVSRRNVAMADTGDAIWILSFGGVLQRLDASTGSITHYPLVRSDGRAAGSVGRLLADRRDRLWIGTDIGLFRFDPGMPAPISVDLAGGGDAQVTALALSVDTRQLLIGSDRGVFALDLDAPTRGALHFTLPSAEPIAVLAIAPWQRQLWLATDRGLFRHDLDRAVTERTELPDALARERIDALVVSGDGTLWFGGQQRNGLVRFDPANGRTVLYRHHPDDPYSLKSDRVNALALDRHDNLWIGLLREGGNRLRVAQQGVERYSASPGRSNSFCALSELPDGRLLIAFCGGSIGILDPLTGKVEDRSADLDRAFAFPVPTLTSHALVPDDRGGFWVPAALSGLVHWQLDTGRAQLYPLHAPDGSVLPPPYLSDALLDRRGRLWVATRRGLAVLTEREPSLRLLDPAVLPGQLFAGGVIELAETGDGRLWVGTSQGLVRFDPDANRGERYTHDADDPGSLSDNTILAIHVDPAGATWIGTLAGINRVVDDANGKLRFRRYGVAEGLPDQSVLAIAADALDKLWVGTNRGIASFEAGHDRFRAYQPADGVPDSNANKQGMLKARDGSMYVGTFSGLLRVNPERLDTADPLPLMLSSYQLGGAEHVNLRGRKVDALGTIYTQAHVRFQVAAFGDPRRLSYRLSGLESEWQDMPPSLTVGYDPLPPGNYRFDVRQMGRDGKWLPAAVSVPVRVSPPPWRTGMAYAFYAGAALIVFVLLATAYRRRRAQEARHVAELSWLANYDNLTGLPNRTRFGDDLAKALDDAADAPLALFFIDLDRFKNINDSLGHRFGDLVLVAAGQRLRDALPATARLARLGGDEFTAILPQLKHEPEAATVAKSLLDAFATPMRVAGSDVVVTLSIGISLAPAHARDGAALIQYADSAMYYAKDSGRNAYRFFRPEMTVQVSRRLALETSLRHALDNGEFHLVFQPKIALASGRVCGAEVLLRWLGAEHGEVAPVEFIPILEDTGMIETVGLWVMQQVCEQLRTWRLDGRTPLALSVNISVHQLIRGDLCERLAQLLSEFEIPRDTLELEITETAVMENAKQMDAALRELRALGLGLSIDDFGTGYSSLAYLSHLPVNQLKIDKSFIDRVGVSESADTLCAAIIAMAHNLKLSVVAEGVESELQHQRLAAMGCDEAQGYWYSVPLRVHELEQYLQAHALQPDLAIPDRGS